LTHPSGCPHPVPAAGAQVVAPVKANGLLADQEAVLTPRTPGSYGQRPEPQTTPED